MLWLDRPIRTSKNNDAVYAVGQVVQGMTKAPSEAERACRVFTARCRGGIGGYFVRAPGLTMTCSQASVGCPAHSAKAAALVESGSKPSVTTSGSAETTGAASA